jgi:hypothetical protein
LKPTHLLCEKEENKPLILLIFKETKRWENNLKENGLQLKEERAYRKLINNTKTLELGNLGTKCEWEHKIEQDRQCTYNVTLRRVRVTIAAAEKQ